MEEEGFTPELRPHIDFKTNPETNAGKFKCEKCQDTGIVKEPDGTCHTCWECLAEGRLDCHSKNLPDVKIKL